MKRIDTDVLVIGGGGAGLMAAHEAAKHPVRVAVVNKGRIQRTGATVMAPGAIGAVDDRWKRPEDSKALHLADTIRGGGCVNDYGLARTVVEQSAETVLELERMGALFQREEDGKQYMLRIDGGHSYPRCPFLEDRVGKEMMKAMVSGLRQQRVELYEDILMLKVLTENGQVTGAVGVSTVDLEPYVFSCGAVILATGGAGTLYANTDNPTGLTGDGYALALECGAQLRDMEFVQFFPVGFLNPPTLRGILAGLMYYIHLLNAKGERFMEKYDPERLELSTRDRVARAIVQEVREGRGTPSGGVYMDMTYQEPGFIAKMSPALYSTYQSIGKDPEKDYIEVAPTVHFFMGGISVDGNWEAGVKGLFGAGETCGGMHGANRLSQNALAELLVSGKVAGEQAAKQARKGHRAIDLAAALEPVESLRAMLGSREGISPFLLREKLRKLMTEKVGVIRDKASLEEALAEVEALSHAAVAIRESSPYMNREIIEAAENRHLLLTARAIILSALERQESRGAHYRSDYPETDNGGYFCNFFVEQKDGRFITGRKEASGENRDYWGGEGHG